MTTRYYEHYADIHKGIRYELVTKLVLENGKMKSRAEKRNPRCAVAFEDGEPVGWATLCSKRHSKANKPLPDFMIYVARAHRRKGIGRRLSDVMCAKGKMSNKTVDIWPHTKIAQRFFDKTGFACGRNGK